MDLSAIPLTTSYNEVVKSDPLFVYNNFNAVGFSALQYLSWLQSSFRMYSPLQVTPNTCSHHEQPFSSLISGDNCHNFSIPRTPTFEGQNTYSSITSSNLVSTFSALMSTFSTSPRTVAPYGSLPYLTHAPIPFEKTMLPTSAIQNSEMEYSSLFYQKQIWQPAFTEKQSLTESERFMTSNSIYNLHNAEKALLDTTNPNSLDQSPVGSTIASQYMGTTVYTPPPSPREGLDVQDPDEDTDLTENTCNSDCGGSRKDEASDVNPTSDSEKTFYTCKWESCGKKFNRSVNLLSHQRSHYKERPFVSKMESCGKRYELRQSLKQRECSQVHGKTFICRWQFCKKSYKRLSYYLRHEQTHVIVKPPADFQSRRNKYKSSGNSQYPSLLTQRNRRIFVCKVKSCGKSYKRVDHLRRHNVTHTGERKFICKSKSCGKSYMRRENLQRHKISHTGERPYACSWDFCGKDYTRQDHLKRHERIHSGEYFICKSPSCGKRYSRSDHLRKHQSTHSIQTPFECKFCKKQFKTLNYLPIHEKTHCKYRKNNRRRTTKSSSSNFRNDSDYLVPSLSLRRLQNSQSRSGFQNYGIEETSDAKKGEHS